MIFYIMGKSASGKDTLYKDLLSKCADLKTITIYTTRPKRDGETDGKEYFFVTKEYLEDNKDRVIEKRIYNTVFGPWIYATIDDGNIKSNENYLMIGTLESYIALKKYFGDKLIFPIYLEVSDDIRHARALKRESEQKIPKYDEMKRRFIADEIDFSDEKICTAGIKKRYNGDDFAKCIDQVLVDINLYKENH